MLRDIEHRTVYDLVRVFICWTLRAPKLHSSIMRTQLVLEVRRLVRVYDAAELVIVRDAQGRLHVLPRIVWEAGNG